MGRRPAARSGVGKDAAAALRRRREWPRCGLESRRKRRLTSSPNARMRTGRAAGRLWPGPRAAGAERPGRGHGRRSTSAPEAGPRRGGSGANAEQMSGIGGEGVDRYFSRPDRSRGGGSPARTSRRRIAAAKPSGNGSAARDSAGKRGPPPALVGAAVRGAGLSGGGGLGGDPEDNHVKRSPATSMRCRRAGEDLDAPLGEGPRRGRVPETAARDPRFGGPFAGAMSGAPGVPDDPSDRGRRER